VVSLLGVGARSGVSLGGRVGSGCSSCTKTSRGTRCQGRTRRGCRRLVGRRWPIGGGGHGDLLEDGRLQLKPGPNMHATDLRQSTSGPAARFPHRHAGGLSSIGAALTAPKFRSRARIQGRGRAAGVGRAGGMSGLDAAGWPAPAAAVALCRCPLLQSAAVALRLASAVPEARGQGRVDAYTGEGSRRDGLGGLMRVGSAASCARVTPSQPDESWLPRPPAAWPSGGSGYL
jgi:hypothetical protein